MGDEPIKNAAKESDAKFAGFFIFSLLMLAIVVLGFGNYLMAAVFYSSFVISLCILGLYN